MSGFAREAQLKTKKAAVVGRAMVRVMLTAMVPEVLQSDNGSECLAKCIEYIVERQTTETEGGTEKGKGPFEIALEKWMVENPDEGGPLVGIYVENAQTNISPTENKTTKSAYKICYEKQTSATAFYILDIDLLKKATTDNGLTAVEWVMELVAHKDANILTTIDEVYELKKQADNLHEVETKLLKVAKKSKYY